MALPGHFAGLLWLSVLLPALLLLPLPLPLPPNVLFVVEFPEGPESSKDLITMEAVIPKKRHQWISKDFGGNVSFNGSRRGAENEERLDIVFSGLNS